MSRPPPRQWSVPNQGKDRFGSPSFPCPGIPSGTKNPPVGSQTHTTFWTSQPFWELHPHSRFSSLERPPSCEPWVPCGSRSGPVSVLASFPPFISISSLPDSWTPHLGNSTFYSDQERASGVGLLCSWKATSFSMRPNTLVHGWSVRNHEAVWVAKSRESLFHAHFVELARLRHFKSWVPSELWREAKL